MPTGPVHVSAIAGSRLLDGAGSALGRVSDVIVRLNTGDSLPPVTGLKARIGGRDLFVPADRIEKLEPADARLSTTKLDLGHFERRPGEVLLREDLLGRSVIAVDDARLAAVHEIELRCIDERWRLVGIDPSWRARLRRLLPRRFRVHDDGHDTLLSWTELEPFVAHVPTARLSLRRIMRLHPAQIADLVEAASHEEGEEILEAVGHDSELEADVFEELDDEHQNEFIRDRSDAEIAEVLGKMASDDAVDLLLGLAQDRRLPVLSLVPPARQRKLRTLLGFNPSTAGGVMTPDFIHLHDSITAAQALEVVRASTVGPEMSHVVYVHDADRRFIGALTISELLRADRDSTLGDLVEPGHPTIQADGDVPQIASLMSDYNLVSLPVVDDEGRAIGALTVDDILELTIPSDWRRRHGATHS